LTNDQIVLITSHSGGHMMSPLLHLSDIRIVNEYVYSPKMAAQETQTLNVFRTCVVMASKKAQWTNGRTKVSMSAV